MSKAFNELFFTIFKYITYNAMSLMRKFILKKLNKEIAGSHIITIVNKQFLSCCTTK